MAFDITDRLKIYESTSKLIQHIKTMSELIQLKHIKSTNFPISFSGQYDKLRTVIFKEEIQPRQLKKAKVKIVCPICSESNEIELSSLPRGVRLIEHNITSKEVCEHSFTVYLDSNLKVLGYKDPEVEISDIKNLFSKLKSPYDK
ncbi:MAG: hypothetical protein ACTSV6_08385 [Candidatus Heimdallarchaeota archaeon]